MIQAAFTVSVRQVIGPSWLKPMGPDDWYDLVAESPPGATEGDIPAMMQTLLADRFHFSAHWEKRKTPVYALEVEAGGLKLKVHQPSPDDDRIWVLKHPVGDAADPQLPPLKAPHLQSFQDFTTGRLHVEGFGTLAELAKGLVSALDRRVVDQTGVDGTFDIVLDAITPEPLSASASPASGAAGFANEPYHRREPDGDLILPDGRHLPGNAPPLFDAVRRLGLRLVPTTVQLDYFVVDHVDKIPTPN